MVTSYVYKQVTIVKTGKFQYNDATMIVDRMHKLGAIDRVSYDTYRRRQKNGTS